jgi:NADH-quinone oxidoreductase subunit N
MAELELPIIQLSLIKPEIIICLTAFLVLMIDSLVERVSNFSLTLVALAGIVLAIFSTQGLYNVDETGFTMMVIRDNISTYLDMLFLQGVGLVILLSHRYAQRHQLPYGEMVALLLFATLGMMIVAMSADLVMVFIGIELLSLCLYVLAGLNKRSLLSGEASMKYFLLGALSTGFFVYGLAFIFGICRTTNLIAIGSNVAAGMHVSPLLVFGFALVLVGIGFKISLVPFHMWAPDVYQGAPTPVTSWIATGSKIAGFAALLRIFAFPGTSFAPLSEYWVHAVYWLAMFTMIIGNAGALVQKDIKRLLAYSSIAHGGYLAMAFVAHNELGMSAILFYMMAYLFTSIGAFGIVILLGTDKEDSFLLSDLSGLAKSRPVLAGLMALFLLSMAGMPPTVGFFGKLWLFGAAVEAGYYSLAVVGALTTLLSFYYYLRVIVYMYMQEPEKELDSEPTSFIGGIAVWASAFAVVYLGVFPNVWWDYIAKIF